MWRVGLRKGGKMADISVLEGLFCGDMDVVDVEPDSPKFDKALTAKYALKNRGSIRMSAGLFYTIEEWEQQREELDSQDLP